MKASDFEKGLEKTYNELVKTTPQEEWENEFDKLREEKWRYLDVGNEYTLMIKSFIKSEKEKSYLLGVGKEAMRNQDRYYRQGRQEVLREVREKILTPVEERVVELKELRATSVLESEDVEGRYIEILRVRYDLKQTFEDLLSTLESKE